MIFHYADVIWVKDDILNIHLAHPLDRKYLTDLNGIFDEVVNAVDDKKLKKNAK